MPETKEEQIEVEIEEENAEQSEAVSAKEQQDDTVTEEAQAADSEASEEDLEQYSDKVKKRIEKLTYKMREAERREKAATEYAQSVKKQMEDLEKRSQKIDQSYITEYDSRVSNEEENIKARLTNAINSGDVNAQMEAQKELARLALETERLKIAKEELEQRQKAEPQAQPQQQPQAEPDPKAKRWAAKNTWFGADEPMTLTAFSIHKKLVEQEYYDPNSDEYYTELDKRLRIEFPHKFEEEETTQARTTRSPVAPASRANGKTSGKKVKLTPSQVAIADKLGVTYEQYAKQLARLTS